MSNISVWCVNRPSYCYRVFHQIAYILLEFYKVIFCSKLATVRAFLCFDNFEPNLKLTFGCFTVACEQAPCEGGKKFGGRSVNPAAKRVGVGA